MFNPFKKETVDTIVLEFDNLKNRLQARKEVIKDDITTLENKINLHKLEQDALQAEHDKAQKLHEFFANLLGDK